MLGEPLCSIQGPDIVFGSGSGLLAITLKSAGCRADCRLGTAEVAAHQLLMQLWMLSSFLLDSLAVGGQTLVAMALGANRHAAAREIGDRILEVPTFPERRSADSFPELFLLDIFLTSDAHPLLLQSIESAAVLQRLLHAAARQNIDIPHSAALSQHVSAAIDWLCASRRLTSAAASWICTHS